MAPRILRIDGESPGRDDDSPAFKQDLVALVSSHCAKFTLAAEQQHKSYQSELAHLSEMHQQQLLDAVHTCLAQHSNNREVSAEEVATMTKERTQDRNRVSLVDDWTPEPEHGPLADDSTPEPEHGESHPNDVEQRSQPNDIEQSSQDEEYFEYWEISTTTGWKVFTLVNMNSLAVGETQTTSAHDHTYEITRTSENMGEQRDVHNNHLRVLRRQKKLVPKRRSSKQRKSRLLRLTTVPMLSGIPKSRDALFRRLEWVAAVFILANTLVMIASFEWQGWLLAVDLGITESDQSWKNAADWFFYLEHFFTFFFLVELIINIYVKRLRFFKECFNIFDAVLVIVTCFEMYVIKPFGLSSLGNVTMLRITRTAKLVRTLRVVRTVEFFSGLRILVRAVASSLTALLWSMVLLFGCMLIGGLLMVGLASDFIEDSSKTLEKRTWAWQHYGTSLRSMYTMYEVTLSGCWPNYVRPFFDEGGGLIYVLFFLVYVTFVVFAVIRVITAIFLKETLEAAHRDADMMTAERDKKRNAYLNKLEVLFKGADKSGDGFISVDEFQEFLEDPQVTAAFQSLDLEIHEGVAMFHLLDDGDGLVTCDEFVQGVSRLKGQARSMDVVALQVELKKILRHVLEIAEHSALPKKESTHCK